MNVFNVITDNRSGTINKDFEWHPLAAVVFNEVCVNSVHVMITLTLHCCHLQGLMFVFDSTDESFYESIKQQFSIYYLVNCSM